MHRSTRLLIGLGAAIVGVVLVHAQEGGSRWAAAADGAVPEGAIAYGQEADGRPEYLCRGALGGGTHLGKISLGLRGCSVAYRGREVMLASYEVLVQPPRPPLDRGPITVMRNRAVIEGTRVALPPKLPGPVPPTPPDSSTKRGFDDRGRPYVEVRLPDGTIKRTQDGGVTLIKPDGTTQFIPNLSVRMDAPPPTPPSLPSDPRQGRAWVDRHNETLLDLISNLVQRDEAEMKKFSDGERAAVGDDVFGQIAYRTTVADFLATQR